MARPTDTTNKDIGRYLAARTKSLAEANAPSGFALYEAREMEILSSIDDKKVPRSLQRGHFITGMTHKG